MNFCKNDFMKLDYINGLLSGRNKKRFQRHLDSCSACSKEIRELMPLVEKLREMPTPVLKGISTVPSSPLAAATPRSPVSSPLTAAGVKKLRWLYVFSATAVLLTIAILVIFSNLEGVRSWISSWLTPSLAKLQGYLGLATNGETKLFQFLLLILSLSSLMLIPSIVENIYLLMRRKWNGSVR